MAVLALYDRISRNLEHSGNYVWPLFLRLILAWEFWESGITKYRGENWFGSIPWADWQKGFPWPFSALPESVNWFFATWGELVFALMLLVGLFTRFTAFSLIIITVVATAAVHWPAEWNSLGQLWEGYVITSNGSGNFKLPLLFVVMLLPLVFHGGGQLSLDHVLVKMSRSGSDEGEVNFWFGEALAIFVLGMTVVFLEPTIGFVLLALSAGAFVMSRLGK